MFYNDLCFVFLLNLLMWLHCEEHGRYWSWLYYFPCYNLHQILSSIQQCSKTFKYKSIKCITAWYEGCYNIIPTRDVSVIFVGITNTYMELCIMFIFQLCTIIDKWVSTIGGLGMDLLYTTCILHFTYQHKYALFLKLVQHSYNLKY